MFKNLEDISKNKLIVNVEEFGPEYNYIEQKNFTDYGYIMYLAGKCGKSVFNLLSFDALWKDAKLRNETFLKILRDSILRYSENMPNK